jgi:hypothetical protein
MPQLIPARIIQTAKSRTLSLKQQAMVATVRLLNPDYDYCFFDNEEVERFVARECPEYRRAFDGFKVPIQRYDFFRYLAVHRLGGFYLDLDVMLARGLDPLRSSGCVFPFEGLTFSRLLRSYGMDWEIGNYAFGASAGHPFLKAVIENCVRSQTDTPWADKMKAGAPLLSRADYFVLTSTGPGGLTRTLAENPGVSTSVTVLFPEDVCDPQTWNVFGTFGVHVMEGTWRPAKGILWRKLANKWEVWALNRLLKESRRSGKTRQLPRVQHT